MAVLFGPDWRKSMGFKRHELRILTLLKPPRGSWHYEHMLKQDMNPDALLRRKPRPATDSEDQLITKVRHMQAAIRQMTGDAREPSVVEMRLVFSSYDPALDQTLVSIADWIQNAVRQANGDLPSYRALLTISDSINPGPNLITDLYTVFLALYTMDQGVGMQTSVRDTFSHAVSRMIWKVLPFDHRD